jgi:hypothetical protein
MFVPWYRAPTMEGRQGFPRDLPRPRLTRVAGPSRGRVGAADAERPWQAAAVFARLPSDPAGCNFPIFDHKWESAAAAKLGTASCQVPG